MNRRSFFGSISLGATGLLFPERVEASTSAILSHEEMAEVIFVELVNSGWSYKDACDCGIRISS